MYEGGRGNELARWYARFWARLFRLGLFPRRWVTLEVPGRRSGRMTSLPLGMADVDDHWYLVSMLGECNWVANVRAAGGHAVLRRLVRRPVRLIEVPVEGRGPILARYVAKVPGGRPHIPVEKGAPVSQFASIAARYPVFEVRAETGVDGHADGLEPDRTWAALAGRRDNDLTPFSAEMVEHLPAPAQRFLLRAIPEGAALWPVCELSMTGEIRLGGRWFPFRARQILRAGVGFFWKATVGGRILRFDGFDCLEPAGARMQFRLHGLVPVATASGGDTARSAAGRLASETVAWLPQALLPATGARWEPIDDHSSMVNIDAGGEAVQVQVEVDREGRLKSIGLERWKTETRPPSLAPFGGLLNEEFVCENGVRIAGTGSVGWEWGTPQWLDGEFFRFQITRADMPGSPP